VLVAWAGLAVTLSLGAVTMVFQRRAGLPPLARLVLALLATGLLLGQLQYATAGGFYGVGDPALTAAMLQYYGLHVLAWLPPLVLFAATALYGARAIVEAFREHFGSRTPLHTLRQATATLGAAGVLYFVAFRIEWAIRTDTFRGVAFTVEQIAATRHEAPPFPIDFVLFVIAVAAFVLALARPVVPRDGAEDTAPLPVPRRYAIGVALAALVCAGTITLLARV
jgi:hypothetical protein